MYLIGLLSQCVDGFSSCIPLHLALSQVWHLSVKRTEKNTLTPVVMSVQVCPVSMSWKGENEMYCRKMWFFYRNKYSWSKFYFLLSNWSFECVIPENINTSPQKGTGNYELEVWGMSKTKVFEGKESASLEFPFYYRNQFKWPSSWQKCQFFVTAWSHFTVIVWLEICVQLQSVLQALKGLALLRSGKTAESEALMEEIMEAKPADDPTLQAMTICYREMQKCKNNFLKGKIMSNHLTCKPKYTWNITWLSLKSTSPFQIPFKSQLL